MPSTAAIAPYPVTVEICWPHLRPCPAELGRYLRPLGPRASGPIAREHARARSIRPERVPPCPVTEAAC
jgi:hypothetical protein